MFSCAAKVVRRRIDIERRLGGIDHRLLHVELRPLARDGGFGRSDVGLGLVERDLEIAVHQGAAALCGISNRFRLLFPTQR